MYDWIIIGGGIHGCTIATFLIKSGKANINNFLIIDPNKEPLSKWKRNTDVIGMEYLRSPSVHHMDLNPFSLQKYGKYFGSGKFYGAYKRPSRELFNEHCTSVLNEIEINKAWYTGKVNSVTKHKEYWNVQTSKNDSFLGRNIVIAIGKSEQHIIPEWAENLNKDMPNRVYHVFDEKLPELQLLAPTITVIGGGITAAHITIKLTDLFPGKITLLKRHDFRIHPFDSDPGWLGPKNLQFFLKNKDYHERRKMIQQARYKGSIPHELHRTLLKMEKERKLTILSDEVISASSNTDAILLNLKQNHQQMKTNSIILATGFQAAPPNQQWLKKLIVEQNLPCAMCGYPIVNKSLEWCPHLYVSGPLAELEVGPVSRNISGARKAAERILLSTS